MRTVFLAIAFLAYHAADTEAQLVARTSEAKRSEHLQFQASIERMIATGGEAAANEREQRDLKTLQWLLREHKKHVAAGDWKRADEMRSRMEVALQRTGRVVADAPRRKAERERAERERQHAELMRQRERQHREEMDQRELHQMQQLNALRNYQVQPTKKYNYRDFMGRGR